MRTMLMVTAAAAALIGSIVSANAGYSAIASGVNGVGWASGYPNMEAARAVAVALCRRMGGSCSASTAEADSWFYAAGRCDGVPYTAASPQGVGRAIQLVYAKGAADGNYRCTINMTH